MVSTLITCSQNCDKPPSWTFFNVPPFCRIFLCDKCILLGGHCCGAAYCIYEFFVDYKAGLLCLPTKICLFRTKLTDKCVRIFFLNLVVDKFQCKYLGYVCRLVVVRHIANCERFNDFKAGISCLPTTICLFGTKLTDKCRRNIFINLVVDKFQCKYLAYVCRLVVVRHIGNYERFNNFKAGLSCLPTKMCLFGTKLTDKCRRNIFY